MASRVPAAVKDAVQNFRSVGGFTLKPPLASETSYIFDYGVRVEYVAGGKTLVAWICRADTKCRATLKDLILLSAGRTSKAVKHLREVHNLWSEKTLSEETQKRKRDDEEEHIRSSHLYNDNPRRMNLLLETLKIVRNNLPFNAGESKEARLLEALTKRDEVKTPINAKLVKHSIVELYASTKLEVTDLLATAKLANFSSVVMMTDFWVCKTANAKYLGLRAFVVDENFELKTFLIGVRKFDPPFEIRKNGIAAPFYDWLVHMAASVGLSRNDFFAGSSDGGADVKRMITKDLNLRWEWCLAHMMHAATKAACGMDVTNANSKNTDLTTLITNMKATIFQVKSVEKLGNLFAALNESEGSTTQLLDYTPSRFLSITSSMSRVIEKWEVLEEWFNTRIAEAIANNTPPPSFPLANRLPDLEQIVSLLMPITKVKRMCQALADNQVECLLGLFLVRRDTLKCGAQLKDYRSTPTRKVWIPAEKLTPLAVTTRKLLQENLDSRFFRRYTDPVAMAKCPFMLEMQMRLHPDFKQPERSINAIVRLCSKEAGLSPSQAVAQVTTVNRIIDTKLRDLVISIHDPAPRPVVQTAPVVQAFDELREEFSSTATRRATTSIADHTAIDEEIEKWRKDTTMLTANVGEQRETVLAFWRRMEEDGVYKILPKVVRVLFAMPASSAHIERDFSVCGVLVSPNRSRMDPKYVDMCSFLNRNGDYIDLAQCSAIPTDDLANYKPAPVPSREESTGASELAALAALPEDFEEEMAFETQITAFSHASIDDEY